MTTIISGTAGVTFPAGGLGNPAGAVVGTTDTQTLTNKTIQGGAITSGTAQASTSGTSIDFTSIPSWVKRITVMLAGVSTNGTGVIQIQIGSGSFTTSGYLGAGGYIQNAAATASSSFTSGFAITSAVSATSIYHGSMVITSLGSNTWVANGAFARSDAAVQNFGQGSIALGGTLDRVRITTVGGTDTFDAGSINLLYE